MSWLFRLVLETRVNDIPNNYCLEKEHLIQIVCEKHWIFDYLLIAKG